MNGNIAAAPAARDTALEYMERALTILQALDMASVVYLQEAIDYTMDRVPAPAPRPGEDWGVIIELPHLMGRVLYLHRQYGLTIAQIAGCLGIAADVASAYLAQAEEELTTP